MQAPAPKGEPQLAALPGEFAKDDKFRILSLDGGGAKGFYTLGVLYEVERMLGCPLYKCFDLVFGTSTGSIIASLLALGFEVEEIHALYKEHLPPIMKPLGKRQKSLALARLADAVYGKKTFEDVRTGIGVVTTKWVDERPMIFKGSVEQAHGRKGSFVAGFGVTIADAVQASCSAYPFFLSKTVRTSSGDKIELIDGGYCANNPTLYAIADAVNALKKPHDKIRVLSVGVGEYPEPGSMAKWILRRWPGVQLLQKTLGINTQSMEQLRFILFKDIPTIRINDRYTQPEMATDFLEYNLTKLNLLRQRGRSSFEQHEGSLRELFST